MHTKNKGFLRFRLSALVGLLVLAAFVGGCDTASDPIRIPEPRLPDLSAPRVIPPAPPSPPWYPTSMAPLQGHFEGDVTINGIAHSADGLITADGLAHFHISGPESLLDLSGSAQFVGEVAGDANRLDGSGTVVGQACAQAQNRFCTAPAAAEISLTLTPDRTDGRVTGEVRVATTGGNETWPVEMYYPRREFSDCIGPCYVVDASLAYASRFYYLQRADFVRRPPQTTLMSVDADGRLFFQEPASGCIGNGVLSPHLDGSMNVFDATLIMETCKDGLEYLNGEFKGVATIHTACPEFDCISLRIYLAAVDQAPPRRSVTLWWRGW